MRQGRRIAIGAAMLAVPLAALSLASGAAGEDISTRGAPVLDPARTQFVLRCGGCHGTLGVSPPLSVPSLKGTAGWFLCTAEGRDYIARLPNVTRVPLSDGQLADVLNFVTFELGEGSAPAAAKRYTAEEIAGLRARPLGEEPLLAYRRQVVEDMVAICGAPEELLVYGQRQSF